MAEKVTKNEIPNFEFITKNISLGGMSRTIQERSINESMIVRSKE